MFQVFSSCVGLFRSSWVNQAFQVVLGRFGCVFEFVLVVFYVVVDRLKLLQLVSRGFRMAMFVLGCLKLFTLCLGCSRWVSSGLRCCSLF